MMEQQQFDNVWDAIADTSQEALKLKLRSRMPLLLKSIVWHKDTYMTD